MNIKDTKRNVAGYYLKIEQLTDEEFIWLSNGFWALASIQDKVTFLCSQLTDITPLFASVTRQINGQACTLGMNAATEYDAERIANFYIDYQKDDKWPGRLAELEDRLDQCFTKSRQLDLIEEELKVIQVKIEGGRSATPQTDFIAYYLANGYIREKRMLKHSFIPHAMPNATFVFPNEQFKGALVCTLEGVLAYRQEGYLKRRKNEIEANEDKEADGGSIDVIEDYIEKEHQNVFTTDTQPEQIIRFSEIFCSDESHKTCLSLLDHVEVTENQKPIITKGKGGKLFGAIIALKGTPGIFKREYTDDHLLKYFNTHLNTQFAQIKRKTRNYEESFDDSIRFLRNHRKKSGNSLH